MTEYATERVTRPRARQDTAQVLCVDDDEDYVNMVATRLSDYEDLKVTTETSAAAALDSLGQTDCLVSDYEMPGMDGLELLATVREYAPQLPFVLFTGTEPDEICDQIPDEVWTDDQIPDEVWTEYLRKGNSETTMSILAGRIRRLVDHHRTLRDANRSFTAIEATGDGIATVSPDGTITFVNRVFASHFGVEPDDLVGRPWQTCFPDDEVDRFESTALRTVRDDWQWTGGCVCETDDGETFTVQTCVAGLDDGSFVICLTGSDDE